ncbi:hypothetical protein niasHT_032445 [Heterodera trifolii]|uniref:Uncharacterized protein n=1 Tax=Heterodera trifolii TaxID=157864 RepID=A0ABD2IZV5_9BILA
MIGIVLRMMAFFNRRENGISNGRQMVEEVMRVECVYPTEMSDEIPIFRENLDGGHRQLRKMEKQIYFSRLEEGSGGKEEEESEEEERREKWGRGKGRKKTNWRKMRKREEKGKKEKKEEEGQKGMGKRKRKKGRQKRDDLRMKGRVK